MQAQKTGTPKFNAQFHALTSSTEAAWRKSQKQLEKALGKRRARLELLKGHIKNGGVISPAQMKKLSFPERKFVEMVQIGEDPDVRQTLKDIEGFFSAGVNAVTEGAKKVADFVKKVAKR